MKLFRHWSLLACLALAPEAALGHAIVLASTPHPDETLDADEVEIEIRFNSRIDAARSHLKVYKADGASLALPIAAADSDDTLKARTTRLEPGSYRLHWQTLSPDGHISQGDIPFAVRR